jgi:hypothetical protein
VDFWKANFSQSWQDFWNALGLSPFLATIFGMGVFVISLYILHKIYGWASTKVKIMEAAVALFVTSFLGAIIFLIFLIFISPNHLYKRQRNEIETLTNHVAQSDQLSIKIIRANEGVKDENERLKTALLLCNSSNKAPISISVSQSGAGDIFTSQTITNFDGEKAILDYEPKPHSIIAVVLTPIAGRFSRYPINITNQIGTNLIIFHTPGEPLYAIKLDSFDVDQRTHIDGNILYFNEQLGGTLVTNYATLRVDYFRKNSN